MKIRERLVWHLRLLLFPTVRVHVHIPVEGEDRDKNWRKFSPETRDAVVLEIETYLKDRFQGLTYEFYWKSSRGTWRGKLEKNQVFYVDLEPRLYDIRWFLAMKNLWRSTSRFNQEVIYIAMHPIWTFKETTQEKTGPTDPEI